MVNKVGKRGVNRRIDGDSYPRWKMTGKFSQNNEEMVNLHKQITGQQTQATNLDGLYKLSKKGWSIQGVNLT